MTIKNRLDAAEKYLKQRNPSVGIVLPMDGGWRLFINGSAKDFDSEKAAIECFYRTASQDAIIITW